VRRSDDARHHCLLRCTRRACGLASASAEERDDATAHVPLGEVNVRDGRRVFESVAKLIRDGVRVAVDLGLELPLASGGARAGPYTFLVTAENGLDVPASPAAELPTRATKGARTMRMASARLFIDVLLSSASPLDSRMPRQVEFPTSNQCVI